MKSITVMILNQNILATCEDNSYSSTSVGYSINENKIQISTLSMSQIQSKLLKQPLLSTFPSL